MGSIFDTVLGLPMHPLVDHFAVVLFPLGLLATLAILVIRPWRERYGVLTMLVLTVGTALLLVAKESGERLAGKVGLPEQHAQFAEQLVWVALPTWVLAVLWFLVSLLARRRARRPGSALEGSHGDDGRGARVIDRPKPGRSVLGTVLGLLTAIGAIASLVLVSLTGHTGAQATWAGTGSSSGSAAASSGASTSGSTASGSSSGYSLSQVSQHANQSSCWSAIDGKVYDLTKWISQHPGGSDKILSICGKDGSSAFDAQHGQDAKPKQVLAGYEIGSLAG